MRFSERVGPPAIWWVLAFGLALSLAAAVGFYVGAAAGLGIGIVALAVAAALLISGSTRIEVDDQLRVGRAMIDFDYVGDVRALDEAETAERIGPKADARAYLVLRPYAKTAVEIEVVDDADPVPYWLVSTRRPVELAAAVRSARQVPASDR